MRSTLTLALVTLAAALGGCAQPRQPSSPAAGGPMGHGGPMSQAGPMGHGMMGRQMAVATLSPTQGHAVTGIVMFHAMGDHVMAHAHVAGLKPNAEHGFHLHEKGSCASADGTSAGGHFNPAGAPHGPQDAAHHAGDMPALKADANGVADVRFMLRGVSVGAGAADIVNRAVIVHAEPDDYKTQPTGNSGARLACGVVAKHP
ncbi:MAG: superoxide dismutase family protein [Pseudomonadota bacterium]